MNISKERLKQIGREIGDDAYILSLENKIVLMKSEIEAIASQLLDVQDEYIKLRLAAKEYHEENGNCSWGFDYGKPCPLCCLLKK